MMTSPASFAEPELVARVAANLEAIRRRIRLSGRDDAEIRIVAVTKTFPAPVVRAVWAVGLRTVGENYVDEMAAKRAEVSDLALRWHYLGALQTNKIARALESADLLCGVSRKKELEKIAAVRPGASLYVQVDFTQRSERNGAPASEVGDLVATARRLELDVRGLMVVAPPELDEARQAFVATVRLADDLGVAERSMGMTEDLEIACEMGSTEVRIGRGLLGARPLPTALA